MYTSTDLVIIFTCRAFVMIYMDIIVSGYICTARIISLQLIQILILMMPAPFV